MLTMDPCDKCVLSVQSSVQPRMARSVLKRQVLAQSCDSGTASGCWWTVWSVTCAPSDNEHLETGSTLMKHFKLQRMAPHITYKEVLVKVILKSQIIPNIY